MFLTMIKNDKMTLDDMMTKKKNLTVNIKMTDNDMMTKKII